VKGRRIVFPAAKRVELEDFTFPAPGQHQLLIRTELSLISAGTELTNLLGERPNPRFPVYPGYSNVGLVEAVGAAITGFQPGDRVVTMGRHASHFLIDLSPDQVSAGQYIERVPEDVSPAAATFTVLGSVAMHGVRKAEPQLKQSAAVIGQGVVGQLISQLARLAGCWPVIGIDTISLRLEKAKESGTPITVNAAQQDPVATVREITRGEGVNLGFDATRNPQSVLTLMEMAAQSGKVIVVGSIPRPIEMSFWDPFQMKELTLIGVHQPKAPLLFHPYYPWTQSRNRQAFLDLLQAGLVRVGHLITHQLPPEAAPDIYAMVQRGGDDWLGIVFDWR